MSMFPKVTVLLLPDMLEVVCKDKRIRPVGILLSPLTWVGQKGNCLLLLCPQDNSSHNLKSSNQVALPDILQFICPKLKPTILEDLHGLD